MSRVAELELILDDGSPVVAGHFFRAGAGLVDLLDELSDAPVAWLLTALRLGSSVARVSAPPGDPDAAGYLRLAAVGLAAVSAGESLPVGWDPDAVMAARRFAAADNSVGTARLTLVEDGHEAKVVELTRALAQRLADLQPAERTMPGAVRGLVVGVSVAHGNRASLRSPSGTVVKVAFDDDLRIPLRDSLYDDVELTVQVGQDGSGHVFHIRAEAIRQLAVPNARWEDLFGLNPDITGGVSVSEYLESARGEA